MRTLLNFLEKKSKIGSHWTEIGNAYNVAELLDANVAPESRGKQY